MITADDLAYEPTVAVEAVYRVICDGGCSWEWISTSDTAAKATAEDHRRWHRDTLNTLESPDGPCGYCEADGPVKLAEPRFGGLPYLYCGTCGSDWW